VFKKYFERRICMKVRNEKGFTLIEVIVVAAIIAILAGILVPMLLKEIDESRITRASGDIRSISSAILVFKKDTAQWPVMDAACDPGITLLFGSGNMVSNLAAMGYDASVANDFKDHLTTYAGTCYNNWKGPYITPVTPDPWGNAYVINANGFPVQGRQVWLISAGPDGKIDTPSNSETIQGDDVGTRIK
jgi:general secretion pathway protein G